jgi:hypothetical protein
MKSVIVQISVSQCISSTYGISYKSVIQWTPKFGNIIDILNMMDGIEEGLNTTGPSALKQIIIIARKSVISKDTFEQCLKLLINMLYRKF